MIKDFIDFAICISVGISLLWGYCYLENMAKKEN